jgi:hypothetical protein
MGSSHRSACQVMAQVCMLEKLIMVSHIPASNAIPNSLSYLGYQLLRRKERDGADSSQLR